MGLTIFLFLLPAIRPLARRVGRAFRAEEVEKVAGD
jgi:hypothetical protein